MKHVHLMILLAAGACSIPAHAADPRHSPPQAMPMPPHDARQLVRFPLQVKRETLATMRRHLQGLAAIQAALADDHFGEAARIATMTLGMSSMATNQGEEEARYMPPGMKMLGMQLHRQAEAFALAAQNAAVTGDTRKPLRLLSRLTQTCVACHAAYRLR